MVRFAISTWHFTLYNLHFTLFWAVKSKFHFTLYTNLTRVWQQLYTWRYPGSAGFGCSVAPVEGEGLRQTDVKSDTRLAGAGAQRGKSRLKRIRRLDMQSRILRMMVSLSALLRGSTTSRNTPAPSSSAGPEPSARLYVRFLRSMIAVAIQFTV